MERLLILCISLYMYVCVYANKLYQEEKCKKVFLVLLIIPGFKVSLNNLQLCLQPGIASKNVHSENKLYSCV